MGAGLGLPARVNFHFDAFLTLRRPHKSHLVTKLMFYWHYYYYGFISRRFGATDAELFRYRQPQTTDKGWDIGAAVRFGGRLHKNHLTIDVCRKYDPTYFVVLISGQSVEERYLNKWPLSCTRLIQQFQP